MKKVYDLVKSWFDDNYIGDQEWQEFCVAVLEMIMEENEEVLKRLKKI